MTSVGIAIADPPVVVISAATEITPSSGTPVTATDAPSAAINLAVAAPIPEPAPVIMATLFLSFPLISDYCLCKLN